jgi:hypothetical protein
VATSPDLETIQSDLESLKRDLAALMSHLKIGLTEGVGAEASRLGGLMCEQGKAVQRQVREQPLLFLAGAFAVGFLGSRVLLR